MNHAEQMAKLACEMKQASMMDALKSPQAIGALGGAALGGGAMALTDYMKNKERSNPLASGATGAILGATAGLGAGQLYDSGGAGLNAITDPGKAKIPLPNGKQMSLNDIAPGAGQEPPHSFIRRMAEPTTKDLAIMGGLHGIRKVTPWGRKATPEGVRDKVSIGTSYVGGGINLIRSLLQWRQGDRVDPNAPTP